MYVRARARARTHSQRFMYTKRLHARDLLAMLGLQISREYTSGTSLPPLSASCLSASDESSLRTRVRVVSLIRRPFLWSSSLSLANARLDDDGSRSSRRERKERDKRPTPRRNTRVRSRIRNTSLCRRRRLLARPNKRTHVPHVYARRHVRQHVLGPLGEMRQRRRVTTRKSLGLRFSYRIRERMRSPLATRTYSVARFCCRYSRDTC